ncbi:MAG: DNA polymerase III subunit delta [candidate division Zixibacteria bacterium]|nr:DNA polymerase III subunit delta [candidate division Zixibacteria bacterium]
MIPIELNRELETGRFRPLYYFFGTEDYRIKEAEKTIVKKFLPRTQLSINHYTLSAAKSKLSDVLTELSIFPMFGERQVFTIGDIHLFSLTEIEEIVNLLTPGDPNRIVILTTPSSKSQRKDSKVLGFLKQKTAAVEFNRLPEDMAERKIMAILRENQISIEPEALKIVIMLSGGNLGGLTEEINKLVNYVGQGGNIKKDDIALLSSDYQIFQIYELANAAAFGDFDKALKITNFLFQQGEKATSLLFYFGQHFIELYLLKNRKAIPWSKKDVGWKYRGQTDLYDNEQLEKIITLISKADNDLRNNLKPESLIIEKLIFNIYNLRKRDSRE